MENITILAIYGLAAIIGVSGAIKVYKNWRLYR